VLESSVADPGHFDTNPDPRIRTSRLTDPAPVSDLQDANKKLLFKGTFTSFFKYKKS
jgi:hypothetical protein